MVAKPEATLNYYNSAAYRRQLEAANAPKPKASRLSAWLKGESIEQYQAKLAAAGETITPHKLYMEKEAVRLETEDMLKAHGAKAYKQLYNAMTPEVKAIMRPGGQTKTLDDTPHLGYINIAEMPLYYPDGSKSIVQFVSTNFEATVIPGQEGLQFKGIPKQHDNIKNKETLFAYGRKITPDGTPGEIDPNFAPNGIAYQPKDLREFAVAMHKVGQASVKSILRLRAEKAKEAQTNAAPRPSKWGQTPTVEAPKSKWADCNIADFGDRRAALAAEERRPSNDYQHTAGMSLR